MKQITPTLILKSVAEYFCISEYLELLEQNNSAICAMPRQISMLLMKELLHFKNSQIADIFRRNHTTVQRSIIEVKKRMKQDEKYRATVEGIRAQIEEL